MESYHWDDLELTGNRECCFMKSVAGDNVRIARTEMEIGSHIRQRRFPNETFIMIMVGMFKVCVDGRDVIIGSNQILHLPADIEHDIEALDRTLALEIHAQPSRTPFKSQGVIEDENYLWGV